MTDQLLIFLYYYFSVHSLLYIWQQSGFSPLAYSLLLTFHHFSLVRSHTISFFYLASMFPRDSNFDFGRNWLVIKCMTSRGRIMSRYAPRDFPFPSCHNWIVQMIRPQKKIESKQDSNPGRPGAVRTFFLLTTAPSQPAALLVDQLVFWKWPTIY